MGVRDEEVGKLSFVWPIRRRARSHVTGVAAVSRKSTSPMIIFVTGTLYMPSRIPVSTQFIRTLGYELSDPRWR